MGDFWRLQSQQGFHNNLAQGARVDFDNVPVAALELVTWVAQELGIDHAGFDIAIVDGHPWLLEFNTFFGMEAMRARAVNVGSLVLDYLASRNDEPQDPPTRPSAWNAAWGRRTARGVRRRRAA